MKVDMEGKGKKQVYLSTCCAKIDICSVIIILYLLYTFYLLLFAIVPLCGSSRISAKYSFPLQTAAGVSSSSSSSTGTGTSHLPFYDALLINRGLIVTHSLNNQSRWYAHTDWIILHGSVFYYPTTTFYNLNMVHVTR